MADLLVPKEDVPLREENGPVAILRAYQRQCRRAGIGHVGADVEEIFEKPEAAEGYGDGFALPPEEGGAEQGDNKLAERASENPDGVAEPTEEEVATLMNHEIGIVDEEKTSAVSGGVKKEKKIEYKPSDAKDAEDGLPIGEIAAEEGHGSRLASNVEGQKRVASRGFLGREGNGGSFVVLCDPSFLKQRAGEKRCGQCVQWEREGAATIPLHTELNPTMRRLRAAWDAPSAGEKRVLRRPRRAGAPIH
jgi:hypothetical protein